MAEELSQSLHDCKTETGAPMIHDLRTLIILFKYASDVSTGIPTPLSQTSMWTLSSARRHPINTFPPISVAYRIRNQIADHFFEHSLITTNHEPGWNDA